jgi:hypothetical protein
VIAGAVVPHDQLHLHLHLHPLIVLDAFLIFSVTFPPLPLPPPYKATLHTSSPRSTRICLRPTSSGIASQSQTRQTSLSLRPSAFTCSHPPTAPSPLSIYQHHEQSPSPWLLKPALAIIPLAFYSHRSHLSHPCPARLSVGLLHVVASVYPY